MDRDLNEKPTRPDLYNALLRYADKQQSSTPYERKLDAIIADIMTGADPVRPAK
jgi:hypothetical protein